VDVDRILARQRRDVSCGTVDAAADGDAGIVHEDVEMAKVLRDVVDQRFDRFRRSLVGLVGAGIDTLGLQLRDDRFSLLGRSDIADGDIGPFVGQCAGRGRTDASRAAGDEGYLS